MRKIPFSKVVCDGNELANVQRVLASGWLTTAGRAVEFEERFAAFVGAPHACAVNSCTAALHLAMESLGVGEGDRVLVPTWTFTATAEVVRYLGADPVFLDVDYGTTLLTPEIVAEGLKRYPDAKALMVVHFGGHPARMIEDGGSGIVNLCHSNGVRVVEDAAHAFPTRLGGRLVGTFGDITCFSFYANKTITTGEGGMLVTGDEEIWRRAKIMRLHGIDRDVWNRFTSDKPSWEYDVVAPGYKYNMPDLNAAIGLAQLDRAEEFRRERERCARFYFENLADCPDLDLPQVQIPFADHAWHLFPVVLRETASVGRNWLIEQLAARGIGTSVHYKPVHRLTYYAQRYGLRTEEFPNAERLWRGCLSLPIYPSLTVEELECVCSTIKELISKPIGVVSGLHIASEQSPNSKVAGRKGGTRADATGQLRSPKRIRLSVPHASGHEARYIEAAFASNWLSTAGPNIEALEQRFGVLMGRSAVAVSCGTSAMHLGLRVLGVGAGDEVVVPSLTFVASCNPILYLGARPVFIDSERSTWNLDPMLLAQFLRNRAASGSLPKVVIVVHLFGQSADLDPIMDLCRKYQISVLEDAAESLGALYKGRQTGTVGDVGVFSFNGNKIITGTSGGMLVTERLEWANKARFWSTQALDRDPDGVNNYVHSECGHNYRMSNVLAGIVLGQMEVLPLRIRQRRAVAFRYRDAFEKMSGVEMMPQASYGLHTNWLSCFLIEESKFGISATELIRFLESANVEARPVWRPMHTQPLYGNCETVGGTVSEELNRRGICLPSSSCLSLDDQEFVIECVRRAHEMGRNGS